MCGVLGHLAPVHRCARLVRCFACAVSWATRLLFTGVPARRVVLRVRCPGSLGSCSPVCPLGVLCCVCGVLGHLAPVHRCARCVCCVACAVSWATWLLFTGVSARCVALRVRCPGPLGSRSPVCPLGVLPVCAVSWATWLLLTGVPARCVVLLVRCPGPLGSCSPVCRLGPLLCVCGVLGLVAPVHRCARSVCPFSCAVSWRTWLLFTGVPARCVACVCGVLGHLASFHRCARLVRCFACAVSWATWLLFTGVLARCVVLRVRCPGPLGSCSPVRSPGVLCGVLGHLAPDHPCARSVCCAVGCVCGASLRGAHSSIRTVAICSRQELGTLRARTRPSGRRLFVAGRGWVPSGRTRVNPDGGCSVGGRGWVRCRARPRSPGRRLVLLGTCPRAVAGCMLCLLSGFAAPGGRHCLAPVRVSWLWPAACLSGVPRGPAWCAAPRPVRSLSVLQSAFPTPWCLSAPRGLAPPALLGGCAGRAESGREPGSLCLPVAPAEAGVLGSLRVVPVRGPAMGLSLAGHSGVRLGLCVLRWLACVDPVTDASGFPYRPSFDGGLGRCTRAVSCGRPHLPLRVGGRHAWVPCVCACGCSSWPGRPGRPPGRVLVRLTFSFGRFFLLLCLAPSGQGLPLSWSFGCPPLPLFLSFFFFSFSVVVFLEPPLSLAFFGFRSRVPPALALCVVCFVRLALLGSPCALASLVLPLRWLLSGGSPPPPFVSRRCCRRSVPCFRFFFFLCALSLSPDFSFLRPRVPWALALCFMCFSGPPAARLSVRSRLVCASRLAVGCFLVVSAPPPFVSRGFRRCRSVLLSFFFSLRCAPPLSVAFSGFRPRVPWASALCVVCFVGLPLLGSPCALASSVLSAWPLAAPWWLLPPPPLCVSRFSSLPLGAVCRVLCCAVRPWVRCCPALLRVVPPGVVLLCAVLFCCARLVPLPVVPCPLALPVALGPCAVRRCVLRCSPALCALCCVCFVVVWWCALLFAALLCAVCVLGCCAVCSLSSPLCAVLCFAVLVRLRCAVRVVRAVAGAWCCGALLCVELFPLVCCGAVLGLVARGCLPVACFGVGVPVWPRGLLPCGWCGLLWCPASLCRVLWCCAVAWCCAVVLCCCVAVLLVLALPSCGLSCCDVLCCWLTVLFCARWWCLRAVVLFPSCCAFPVFSALCVAVPCCAGCGALLPCVVCCGAVLSRGAVLWCSAVVLRCCWCLLCPPVACRAALCCAVFCCWLSVLFFAWWWRLCAVVPFPSLPARMQQYHTLKKTSLLYLFNSSPRCSCVSRAC